MYGCMYVYMYSTRPRNETPKCLGTEIYRSNKKNKTPTRTKLKAYKNNSCFFILDLSLA